MKRKKIWVCNACGKTAKNKDGFKDISCLLWSIEVWADSIEYSEDTGLVVKADAVVEEKEGTE